MTPQADSTTATSIANGHQNGSTEVNHSVYDLLYSSENSLSFYSSEDQKKNHNIATAGCKHLIMMKNHQATSDHSEAREKFRETFTLAVDYGVAWKIATSEMQMSKSSSDKSRSKKRKLHQDLYSGERSPYGPCTFLQSMWLSLKELAGYAQQDAHEFFISALNQIHADSEDHSMDNCDCVVHQTFAGVLQSNVTCLKCGNVSSAYDPMLDISLDLLPAEKKKKQQLSVANDNIGKLSNTLSSTNDKRETPNSESHQSFSAARRAREPNSLADCLDRYTKSEKLGENQYSCANCGHTFQAAVKQLSVKKLPQVLSFQLKRFEHGKSATKIETKIKFPVDLDMTPYTSDSSESNAKSRRTLKLPLSHNSNLYTLFAVVNHQGKMDTGHYTMFAKHRGQWFKFDDHRVTLSYQKDVLDSKADLSSA
ncbi:hypothetical protein NQZ79_g6951 [Umbelopsis isabellina]|nr:hypothetical protein NQZ79_g6951 [Umbelopsis isabellina]